MSRKETKEKLKNTNGKTIQELIDLGKLTEDEVHDIYNDGK